MAEIGEQSVSAVKWGALTTGARFVLQLATQVILARLLGPENYGLFALALVAMTWTQLFADFGFAWGLVQRTAVDEADIRFAFTWQVISGLAGAVVLFLSAPLVAAFFNDPRVLEVVRWIAPGCVFGAASAVSMNLMRRHLDFKTLGLTQVGSYLVGYVLIGIPLAFGGAGVWALVAAWLAQSFSAFMIGYAVRPHAVRPLLWFEQGRAIRDIGLTVFVTNVCNWILNNIDRLVIGRLLDVQAVGLYTVGYNLANVPNSLLLAALQPAFLAAGARLQDDPQRLRNAYLQIVAAIFVLVTPAFMLAAFLATDLVELLYGSEWAATGTVLTILFAAMPAYILWGMSTPILWNTGRRNFESLLQAPIIAVAVIGLYWAVPKGLSVAALAVAMILALRAVVITAAAFRFGKVAAVDVRLDALRAIVLSALAIGGATVGRALLPSGAGPLSSLLVEGTSGAGLTLFATFARPTLLGPGAWAMLARFVPSLARHGL